MGGGHGRRETGEGNRGGEMYHEENGLRARAIRAGLLHPFPSASSLSPAYATFAPPPSPSFASLAPPHQSLLPAPSSLFSHASSLGSGVQLFGVHSLGMGSLLEAALYGSKVHLDELSLKISKEFVAPFLVRKKSQREAGKVSLNFMTDLQRRNRITLENTLGADEDSHTVSCAVSSDFDSHSALGVASSHRLKKAWTLFTRYSKDSHAGERFFLQAVHELNGGNKISLAYVTRLSQNDQTGISWIQEKGEGDTKRQISLKGLYDMDGNFSISLKVNIGLIEN